MSGSRPRRWCLLVSTLPSRPAYLRARIRRLLADSGAAPIRKAVYALPSSASALERLQSIAAEVEGGGGLAIVCDATFPDEEVERAIDRACRDERDARLRRWMADASRALPRDSRSPRATARSARHVPPRSAVQAPARVVAPLRRRLETLRALSPADAPVPAQVEALLARLEGGTGKSSPKSAAAFAGRVWVTRRNLHVDRLACAWIVRRFVDPAASFRFVADPAAPRLANEIGFDMPNGEITHQDGGCSAETLIRRSGVDDPALKTIGEIVHDIDLKDGRFGHAETAGFERMLVGMLTTTSRDEDRLERGLLLFDILYAALREGAPVTAAIPGTAPRVSVPIPRRRK